VCFLSLDGYKNGNFVHVLDECRSSLCSGPRNDKKFFR